MKLFDWIMFGVVIAGLGAMVFILAAGFRASTNAVKNEEDEHARFEDHEFY